MNNRIRFLLSISIIKTIRFNLYYFPFKTALRFPALVFKQTELKLLKGSIRLNCEPKPGIIKIGIPEEFSLDTKGLWTKWKCEGNICIAGDVTLGKGTVIRIMKGGNLSLGKHFIITGRSSVVCANNISFGDNCLLSWDVLVMDNDLHKILNNKGEVINKPESICIGNHVWIGCSCLILKGVELLNDIVVAAGSVLTKKYSSYCTIIGGGGILKEDVTWEP